MSEREPQKVIQHVRDANGHRQHLIRSLHKRHLKANGKMSLKELTTAIMTEKPVMVPVTPEDCKAASAWVHNKRAHTSTPPQHIGRTNRVKGKK